MPPSPSTLDVCAQTCAATVSASLGHSTRRATLPSSRVPTGNARYWKVSVLHHFAVLNHLSVLNNLHWFLNYNFVHKVVLFLAIFCPPPNSCSSGVKYEWQELYTVVVFSTVETHLTPDSCLCDACYRHVDRKANCPSYKPSRKRHHRAGSSVGGTGGNTCSAVGCEEAAQHHVRRKWLLKLKRSISKKV